MNCKRSLSALVFLMAASVAPLHAADTGEEIEVTSGAITALTCAIDAKTKGSLDPISFCPMHETVSGMAVYDVAMKDIYLLSSSSVAQYELERAFGGGRIDLVGTVREASDGIAVLDVSEYTITARPKPGAFKGCL